MGSALHEPLNRLTLLDLDEAVGFHPTLLLSPFPEAFGPTLVQERLRQATAVQFLTVREVATRLRVSPATIYALCAKGKLAHARVSHSLRISLRDVEALLRSGSK
jgi:excisionase family DNA binding protein